jgi:hypothetical protein
MKTPTINEHSVTKANQVPPRRLNERLTCLGNAPIAWQKKPVGIVVAVRSLCQVVQPPVAGMRSVSILSASTVLRGKTEASLLHDNPWHYTGVGEAHWAVGVIYRDQLGMVKECATLP